MHLENILVISPNWLGDAVMAMPAVQRLKKSRPDSRLAVLAKPGVAPLWSMHEAADQVVVLPKGTAATFRMAARLRQQRFSTCFILPNSFRSALIPFLAGIPVRRGTAFHGRRAMVNQRVRLPDVDSQGETLHQAREYLTLLCGTPEGDLADTGFHPPSPRLLDDLPQTEGPMIGVVPGAARGESKRWKGFAEAIKIVLRSLPASRVVVAGAPNEMALCADVAESIGPAAINVAGRTSLPEFASLLGSCRLVLCNDSGGMHLASAAGVPVVAIYGLTDPDKTGPIGSNAVVIRAKGVRPSRQIARECPVAIAALASIQPEEVAKACLERLKTPRTGEAPPSEPEA
ncbi:MAG: lipopolysaccharide heptosyltransferase II [Kiritimatiellia bacterium]|jgi:heptosyltransferase-2